MGGARDRGVLAAVVRPGLMLFEVAGVNESEAREAMRLASQKLPIPTQFVRVNWEEADASQGDRNLSQSEIARQLDDPIRNCSTCVFSILRVS